MARTNRKVKRAGDDPATRIAREIDMPASQVEHGNLTVVAKGQYNSDGTRDSIRGGSQTVRRTTKVDQLLKRGIINQREALACEWYHGEYQMQYETKVKVANWEATASASDKAFGHWLAGRAMNGKPTLFEEAREVIPRAVRPMFERVVLEGRPLGKLAITFRSAARKVLEHIEGRVAL